MESLIFSSNPYLIYKKVKKGAILEEDFEDLQTVDDFVNDKEKNKKTKLKNNIDVYYIGSIPKELLIFSEKLLKLIELHFSVNIRFIGELMVKKMKKNKYKVFNINKDLYFSIKTQTRNKKEERLQIYKERDDYTLELSSGDILDMLINFKNKTTLTVLGLTAYNIYNPDITDDTIFGLSCGDGASIISLTECFDMKIKSINLRNKNAFFEMAKSCLHEFCHTIGIDHCVEYHCIMNSLYVKESYKNPIYFCPICLYKLYIGLNLDLEKRFKELYEFYLKNDMDVSALWIKKRINIWNKDKTSLRNKFHKY